LYMGVLVAIVNSTAKHAVKHEAVAIIKACSPLEMEVVLIHSVKQL